MISDREYKFAKKSLIYGTNSMEGICEVLRLAYDLVHDYPDKELKEKMTHELVRAFAMSKKMNKRLIYYHDTYHDTTGKAGKGVEYSVGSKERRTERAKRE